MNRGLISRIMRKRAAFLVAVTILTAGCSVPKLTIKKKSASPKLAPTQDISNLLNDEYWRAASLQVMWSAVLPSRPKMAVVGKRHLIVVDQDNMVYALDRKRGNVKWRCDIELPVDGLSFGSGDVMVLARDVLHRINEERGTLIWTKVLAFVPSAEIVRSRFRICAAGWGSGVYALDADDCYPVWRAGMTDNVLGGMADAGNRVYAVTESGYLSALRGQSGYEEWGLDVGGRVVAGLATDGSIIYVASRDKFLCGCSRLGVLWKIRTNGPIVTTPVAVEGSVYFVAEGDGLYAADKKGKLKWNMDGRIGIVSVGKQTSVLVRKYHDKSARNDVSEIVIVETESGKQRAAVKVPDFNIFPANIEGPEIFCLSESGYIIALSRF